MRRSPIRSRRATPRRRLAPRWTAAEWEVANHLLMIRCNGFCEKCGLPLNGRMERAHRVRRRDGGDRLSNLLALHPECHAWTHAHPEKAREGGWILESHEDPTKAPVLWCGWELSLLADDGSRERLS